MLARWLICCLLALALPLQAQARTGFFACAAPPVQGTAPQEHCAQHDNGKKVIQHAHCAACVAVAITGTPLILAVSEAAPLPPVAPEFLQAGVVLATPQPPPKPVSLA